MSILTNYMYDTERTLRLIAATGHDDLGLIEGTADVVEFQRHFLEAFEP